MRLCRDCRYFGVNANRARVAASTGVRAAQIPQPGTGLLCLHPNTVSAIDPTNGKVLRSTGALAYNQRQFPALLARLFNKCGTSARWFELTEVA